MEQTFNDLALQFMLQAADLTETARKIMAECEARGKVIAERDAEIVELKKKIPSVK